jgi:YD repeat-containing protein
MRTSRNTFLLVMLSLLFCFALQPESRAQRAASTLDGGGVPESRRVAAGRPRGGGIVEHIPAKYMERYQGWKNDLLSTETGRRQWEAYDGNARFSLTILVSDDNRHGAGTSKYRWDDAGELVAATITLGSRIDEGYPNPIYYPVMYSLSPLAESFTIDGNVLAAAKIAHELGHVRQAVSTGGALYRLQNQLMLVYNQILLSNGRNTRDQRLLELARRMGGTPVEIWESREYWGEVNVMLYLRERITDQEEQRALFSRVRRTVELYAKDYADRFEQVTQ